MSRERIGKIALYGGILGLATAICFGKFTQQQIETADIADQPIMRLFNDIEEMDAIVSKVSGNEGQKVAFVGQALGIDIASSLKGLDQGSKMLLQTAIDLLATRPHLLRLHEQNVKS